MKDEIIEVNHIREYDEMVGAETLHPLVNVVDFSRLPPMRGIASRRKFGYYAIYLKGRKYSEMNYGRSTYDYEEGALVFCAPGQVAGVEDDGVIRQFTTRVLMFHPELLRGSYLQELMGQYSFFSYNINEALFPTEEERDAIIDCFEKIEKELRNFDSGSMPIIIDYIKLVLDYSTRYYHRQFADGRFQNHDILVKLEQLLENYLNSEKPSRQGVPTVAYCADKLCLSANYFSDLVRESTGVPALKTIHSKMLDVAKRKLSETNKRVNEVAYEMGFQQPQNFTNWFKKLEGCTPLHYQKEILR